MDAIEALDWGAYSDFSYKSGKYPEILPTMEFANLFSGFVGVAILLVIALLLILVQGKPRAAVVGLISFALAVGLIHALRYLVPRQRPENAANWLGPDGMTGSYPAANVFLFMLTMILLGFGVWNWTQRLWLRAGYAALATFLTVWVCMSQFFLALHFLTDILGAIAGATAIAWIAFKLMEATRPEVPTADARAD